MTVYGYVLVSSYEHDVTGTRKGQPIDLKSIEDLLPNRDTSECVLVGEPSVYINRRILLRPRASWLNGQLDEGDTVLIPSFDVAYSGQDLASTIQLWVGRGIHVVICSPIVLSFDREDEASAKMLVAMKRSAETRSKSIALARKQKEEEHRMKQEDCAGTIHNIPFGYQRAPGGGRNIVLCWDEIAVMRLAYFLTSVAGMGKSAAGRRITELYQKRGKLPPQRRAHVKNPIETVGYDRVVTLLKRLEIFSEEKNRYTQP